MNSSTVSSWDDFLLELKKHPGHTYSLLDRSSESRISEAERDMGKLPSPVRGMLEHFNGAELFISSGPSLTLFGLSTSPLPSEFEWAPTWYIDFMTPEWRANGERADQWAIGMTNYGGLLIVDAGGEFGEWDTNEGSWISRKVPFEMWLRATLRDGEVFLSEAEQ